MLGAREVTEILRLYEECGIETTIGHYGALDGTNNFFDVDVWLRLGDNFPNLSFVRYLSHALECEGRLDADGDIFTSMTEQNDIQDRGRARPKERKRDTPLLEIKCGSRVDGYPEIIETVGHPPSLFSHLCRLVGEAFITCHGWCSARSISKYLESIESGSAGGLSGYSQRVFPSLIERTARQLLLLNRTTRTTRPECGFDRRRIAECLSALGQELGAEARDLPTPAGNAHQRVYCVAGTELPDSVLFEEDGQGESTP